MSQAIHACHFSRILWRVYLGFVGQSSPNLALRVEQPSVLKQVFFQNYNILPRSGRGVRAESLRVGSENTPNFVTFWPTL